MNLLLTIIHEGVIKKLLRVHTTIFILPKLELFKMFELSILFSSAPLFEVDCQISAM